MKANYHTHTHYCGHASGNASDYVKEAIKKGFTVIGISDHAPNSRVNDHNVRMKEHKIDQYMKDIEDAQAKYGENITIYKGLEVEFFYDHDEYYKDLIKKTDYLIHGQHYVSKTKEMHNLQSGFALKTKEDIYLYSEYLCDAMDSGYFDALAHPDLYMCGYRDFDKHAEEVAHIICKKAQDTRTVLEYNANGYRRGASITPQGIKPPYPRNEFWEIAKSYGIETIIGSDCHNPNFLYDDTVKEAEDEYLKLGLNMLDKLDIK